MLTEFEQIDFFLSAFRGAGGRTEGDTVELGPGDDAAILAPASRLVITTDALVERIHFKREWATAEEIGHKALAVNLSDIAAMGARPTTFTCALAFPPSFDPQTLAGIAHGMGRLAGRTGAVLSGGNFTRASELSLTITALGALATDGLRRNGARAGDLVLLLGNVGVAAAELSWLLAGQPLPKGPSALHSPEPLVFQGLRAAEHLHTGIDVSDGLVQDLGHVARASGVRIIIRPQAIPTTERFEALVGALPPGDRLRLLLSGGEDYALVVTGRASAVEALQAEAGGAVIGHVEAGAGIQVEGMPDGALFPGHDHFRAS